LVTLELDKVIKLKAFYINMNGDTAIMDDSPPPPPPTSAYSKELFEQLYNDKLIDSSDIDYMFEQLDTMKSYLLDSSRINCQTIKFSEINMLNRNFGLDSMYSTLKVKFNGSTFMKISSPLFSYKRDKLLLTIGIFCGRLCGGGATYLFIKKEGKWIVQGYYNGWIS
jgi:hypothetical protein